MFALMMEARSTSETMGKVLPGYTAQHPEDSYLKISITCSSAAESLLSKTPYSTLTDLPFTDFLLYMTSIISGADIVNGTTFPISVSAPSADLLTLTLRLSYTETRTKNTFLRVQRYSGDVSYGAKVGAVPLKVVDLAYEVHIQFKC
jgi:hypothetical protein